jgi:hypothetical protein
MKYRVNHFEDNDGERALVRSQVLRARNALKAIALYLVPEAPVEGFVGTRRYAEYRCGRTLVRAVACR